MTMAICGNPDCKARYQKSEFASSFENWCCDDCRNIITQAKRAKQYAKQAVKQSTSKPIKPRSTLTTKTQLKGAVLGSMAYNKEKKARDKKRKLKVAGNQLITFIPKMTKKEAKAEAIRICHLYIRTRDFGKPCPCCQEPLDPNYQAGHFIAAGSCSMLMFDERNIHGQRYECNMFNYGDSGLYEPSLRVMLGNDEVDDMKEIAERNPVVKRTLADYLAISDYYTEKLKTLPEPLETHEFVVGVGI